MVVVVEGVVVVVVVVVVVLDEFFLRGCVLGTIKLFRNRNCFVPETIVIKSVV